MEYTLRPQPGYPFSLELGVDYVLSEAGLSVRTTATNVGDEACPYGCGAHPYLTLGTPTVDTLLLRIPARTALRSDDRGIPDGRIDVEGTDHDFRLPRTIGSTRLDTAFTDLARDEDGVARVELRDPGAERTLTLWVDEGHRYLMVFTGDPIPEVNRRSLAVEPMTCPPNAFRTGDGVIRLEPGGSFSSAWGIAPEGG
jgi:aldose 1-epimerase